jgi:stress response protein SCP2
MEIVTEKLKSGSNAREALQFLLAQNYLDMGKEIGNSQSSKVMFMDPRSMISTIEGMRSVITGSGNGDYSPLELDLDNLDKRDSKF